jgi:HSP20 family protein
MLIRRAVFGPSASIACTDRFGAGRTIMSAAAKGEPLKELTSLQERMNRIFTESVKRIKEIADPEPEKPFNPPVDIYEMPDSFVLLAELPGVSKDSVSVEVMGGTLTIRGNRPPAEQSETGSLYRSERYYGLFERSFSLPVDVASERISARLTDGILTVTIAKPEETTPLTVKIE